MALIPIHRTKQNKDILKETLQSTQEERSQGVRDGHCQFKYPFSLSHFGQLNQLTLNRNLGRNLCCIVPKHPEELIEMKLLDQWTPPPIPPLSFLQELELCRVLLCDDPFWQSGHRTSDDSLCHSLQIDAFPKSDLSDWVSFQHNEHVQELVGPHLETPVRPPD